MRSQSEPDAEHDLIARAAAESSCERRLRQVSEISARIVVAVNADGITRGDRSAQALVAAFASDPDWKVRRQVVRVLKRLSEARFDSGDMSGALCELERASEIASDCPELVRIGEVADLMLMRSNIFEKARSPREAAGECVSALRSISAAADQPPGDRVDSATVAVLDLIGALVAVADFGGLEGAIDLFASVLAPLARPEPPASPPVVEEMRLAETLWDVLGVYGQLASTGWTRVERSEARRRAWALYAVSKPWATFQTGDMTPTASAATIICGLADTYALLSSDEPYLRADEPISVEPIAALVSTAFEERGVLEWASELGVELPKDLGVEDVGVPSPGGENSIGVAPPEQRLLAASTTQALFLAQVMTLLDEANVDLGDFAREEIARTGIENIFFAVNWMNAFGAALHESGPRQASLVWLNIARELFVFAWQKRTSPVPKSLYDRHELLRADGADEWLLNAGMSLPAWVRRH